MARFGLEIDLNARGVTSEVDRVTAHINRALASVAQGAGRRSAGSLRAERGTVEQVGQSRVQQLRDQGAPTREVERAQRQLAQALKDYDLAIRGATSNIKREKEIGYRALARLEQRGARSRDLERQASKPPAAAEATHEERVARRARRIEERRLADAEARADVSRRLLNEEGKLWEAQLEARRLADAVNAARRAQLRRERQAAREAVQGPAGLFQRIQYATHRASHPDTDRVASDMPQLGAFLTQRAITTAGYAAGGAALFAVVNGLREGIQAAERLQRVMVTIEDQFEAVGDAADFSGFRSDVLAIARDTGLAADEVATVGFQMKGVYTDTTEAVRETRAAIRATVVTGIEQKELTDSLTAASLAFGVSIEDITDKAIGLEERFGVLARESLKVFGDMATVATQAGLELNELGALVGAVQQSSGVSGAAIAEGFGRILPAVQGSAEGILTLYRNTSQLAPNFDVIAEAFQEGRGGDVLIQLVRDFDTLDRSVQNHITTLLGGRREARFLNALFGNTSRVIQELDRRQSDAGKTSERFASIQNTLSQSLARVRESFRQIFDDLARMGLFDLLTTMAGGAEIAIRAVSLLTRFLAELNDMLGGLPGKIAAVILGLKGIALAIRGVGAIQNALGGVVTRVAGAAPQAAAPAVAASAVAPAAATAAGSAAAARAAAAAAARQAITGSAAVTASTAATSAAATRAAAAAAARAAITGATGAAAVATAARTVSAATGSAAAAAAARAAITGSASPTAVPPGPGLLSRAGAGAGGFLAGIGAVGHRGAAIASVGGHATTALTSGVLGGVTALAAFTGALVLSTTALRIHADQQQKNDRGEKEVRDRARALPLDELRRRRDQVPNSRSGFFDWDLDLAGLGAAITGNKTPREVIEEQVNEKTASMYRDAIKLKLVQNSEDAQRTLRAIDDGSNRASEEVGEILDRLTADERRQLEAIATRRDNARGVVDDGGQQLALSAEQLSQAFQAGEVSYATYIAGLQNAADVLAAADNVELHDRVVEAQRRVNAAISQNILSVFNFVQQMSAISGQDPTALLPQLVRDISDPRLLPAEATQLLGTYQQIQQQALQRAIQRAPNAAEAQRLAREGVEIDPAVRQRLVQHYVTQLRPGAFSRGLQGRVGRRGLEDAIARFIPDRLRGDSEAIRGTDQARLQEDILREQHRARGTQDPLELARIQQRIAGLQRQAALNETERMQAEIAAADAQRQANSARIGIARSRLALASAAADDDPVADAQRSVADAQLAVQEARQNNLGAAAVNAAMGQVAEAQRAVRDAYRDRIDAQRELTRAQVERDPILVAQVELAAADEEMARAGRDPAARARALASRIRADRTMRDAVRAIADSQLELLKVYAEVGGRTVEAAEIGVRQAQEALNRVIADVRAAGGDPERNAEVNAARGALAQAQGNARDTRLNETQRNIDVALQLERITTGQAIAQLEALLQVPNITKEQTDNLLLKIKQLRDDVGKDFQFNVPSEIRLPTIYEVRRLSAAERGGGGYQDNRVVHFTMTNNNATDYQGAIDRFAAEMEMGSRVYGQSGRAY